MAIKDPTVIANLIDGAFTGRSILMHPEFEGSPLADMGNWGAMVNSLAAVHPAAAGIASTATAPMIIASAIHKFSNGTADIGTYADIAALIAARTSHPALKAMAISFSVGVKIGGYINERWGDEINDAVWDASDHMGAMVDDIRTLPGMGDVFRDLSKKLAYTIAFPKDSPHTEELTTWIETQKQSDSAFQGIDTSQGFNSDQVFGPVAGHSSDINKLTIDLWSSFRYRNPFGGIPLDTSGFGGGFRPGPAGALPSARIDTPWIMFNGNKLCLEPGPRDPLVLDLSGIGIKLSSLTSTETYFDMDNNSSRLERTGWIRPGEGLVVVDLDGNGKIDSARELVSEFLGAATVTGSAESVKPFKNGFDALKSLDSNNDDVFDNKDEAWATVKVWADDNQDGLSWADTNGNGKLDDAESNELLSLDELGIELISLTAEEVSDEYRAGNKILASGNFLQAGVQKEALAVGFQTYNIDSAPKLSMEAQVDGLIGMMAAIGSVSLDSSSGDGNPLYRSDYVLAASA